MATYEHSQIHGLALLPQILPGAAIKNSGRDKWQSRWEIELPHPSKENAMNDDQTIPRLIKFAKYYIKNSIVRCVAILFAVIAIFYVSAFLVAPISAQSADPDKNRDVRIVETWTEEWDPKRSCWIRLYEPYSECPSEVVRPEPEEIIYPLPRFGPFLVLNNRVAGIFGVTDSKTLGHFHSMLKAFPDIDQLNFIDAAGTVDDVANLKLGRIIRARGISTHVPAHGSARSGAVELFLGGVRRTMEKGALFAVHGWRDHQGQEPKNFDQHDPVNELYLDYYIDMGMSHDKSHEFYNMTNSVLNSEALWFGSEEMKFWLAP